MPGFLLAHNPTSEDKAFALVEMKVLALVSQILWNKCLFQAGKG
jgi:competence protein ComGC